MSVGRVARLPVAARLARGAATTRPVRMTVVTATGATVTGTTTGIAVTPVTALGALTGKTLYHFAIGLVHAANGNTQREGA